MRGMMAIPPSRATGVSTARPNETIAVVPSGMIGVPVYLLVAQAYPPLVRWVGQD